MLVYNGKYGGGRMILNPMAILNDGFFEMIFYKNLIGFKKSIKLFEGAKKGGTHIYDANGIVYRISKLRLENKSPDKQDLNIDGEDLTFEKFVQYECLKQELEVIVDF